MGHFVDKKKISKRNFFLLITYWWNSPSWSPNHSPSWPSIFLDPDKIRRTEFHLFECKKSDMNDTLGYFHTIWGKFHSSNIKNYSQTRFKAYSSRYNTIFLQETVPLCPLLLINLKHNFIGFRGCPCPFLDPHFLKIIKITSLQPSKANGLGRDHEKQL